MLRKKERGLIVMSCEIREQVKKHYGDIAANVERRPGGCSCGCSCSSGDGIGSGIYDREYLENLPKEAVVASLGCANPLVFAELKEGEHVLDLGSGGGIDVLMATRFVGPTGKIYGLDMTEEMLALANRNKERMGAANVEFIKGYIEDIPLPDASIDVIISNCVINLSEDKESALSEAFRVLKNGGRLAIADIVALRAIPEAIAQRVEMWSSCLAGTLQIGEYKAILNKIGFKDLEITPAHIYGKEAIEDMMNANPEWDTPENREIVDMAAGAFAGAYIKAKKHITA